MTDSPQRPHVMLTSVGVSGLKNTSYTDGKQSVDARFSAFGLYQLLPDNQRPDEVWFLLTPKARTAAWPAIQEDASAYGIRLQAIDLTGDMDDTREFLETAASKIPAGCRLTLNVTEGLRHHAFLFYALALYLTAFRGVTIEGVWYCRLETDNRDDPKPVIDLKPVLELAHWFHALAVFKETGSLRQIAHRMPAGEQRTLVERLSLFFLNGMPIEAGDAAARLLASASDQPLASDVPLARQIHSMIVDNIKLLSGTQFEHQPRRPEQAKKSIPLTKGELERQAKFIRRYFDTGQFNLAFGLLREWMVNWIAENRDDEPAWLDRRFRESIEHSLGGLGEVLKAKVKSPDGPKGETYKHASVRDLLTKDQRDWAKRWNRVCDIRNILQHHGMKAAVFEPNRGDMCKAQGDWESWPNWPPLSGLGGGHGTLLICSIGRTPGVLYSAVTHSRPDRLLVVCSTESAAAIDEALTRADCSPDFKCLKMKDPYTGVAEFEALIDQAGQWLFEADAVRANLTGGTTLMGVLISRLVQRAAREYQRPVREFVLIDPRTPEEQRSDPWHLGDIHYLDGDSDRCDAETADDSVQGREQPHQNFSHETENNE